MALSNATHGAPGKAHGAGRSAPATGLEFLTGDVGDATGMGKDGVDFSALMHGIIQPVLTSEAAKVAAAQLAQPSALVPQEPDTSAQKPDDAIALLAVALQNGGDTAPAAAPTQTTAPKDKGETKVEKQAQPEVVIAPPTSKAAIRRAAAALATTEEDSGGKREAKENGTVPVAEAAPAPIAIAPTVQPASPVIVQAQAEPEAIRNVVQLPSSEGGSGDRRRGEGRAKTEGVNATPATQSGPDFAPALPTSAKPSQPQASSVSSEASAALKQPDGSGLERIVANIVSNNVQKEDNTKHYNITENIIITDAAHAAPDAGADMVGLPETREGDSAAVQPDPGVNTAMQIPRTDAAGQPSSHPAPVALTPAAGAPSIANTLGQQVVDMGISGQWINDIARQIASISANPGHGSFRIASQELGAVQVDIAPASAGGGSDILMRVDSDAAFAALNEDKERLMQDARMASVRIGELRIDRLAAPQEAARGDMGGNTQQQNPANPQQGNQSSQSQTSAQTGGNGGQQQSRPDAASLAGQNQGGNSPKAPFTTTVMRGADADEATGPMRSGRGDSARYA
ncbi:hypothetical protein [Sphingobium fluviale]|nr:hypothetical protein [Sphingobium fluviale]